MPKADIPEFLRAQLKEQGYSDDVIKALWKWYDKEINSSDISPPDCMADAERYYCMIP
jgi:hypothetical protein